MNAFLDVVFPEPCICCGTSAASHPDLLCPRCRKALRPWVGRHVCVICGIPIPQFLSRCERCRQTEFAFDWARAAFSYEGAAAALIRSFKFGRRKQLARTIASHLEQLLASFDRCGWDSAPLVPVPSSRRGRRRRGFEPAGLIAAELSRARSADTWTPLSETGGVSQKKLDFQGRFAHASESMHFVGKVDPAPRNAILVDDVFTTGATLSRCAELLKAHGTEEVGALVFVMEEE